MRLRTNRILSVILAGGEGKRLGPLTRHRAKPAIPFAGHYRLIDFVLTNLAHSHLLRVHVLTQYQSYSLIRHVSQGWSFSPHLGQYCEVIPATSGEGRGWYTGSADALFKNLDQIMSGKPDIIAVFGADHVYRMDIRQMIDEHIDSGADVSVAVVPQPKEEAHRFGCVQVDHSMRITNFLEKPSTPPLFDKDPTKSLVSMGNYLFNFDVLRDMLESDQQNPDSKHDVGGNILPVWVDKIHLHAYNFFHNHIPGRTEAEKAYWRDVGTVEAYWKASMDLVSVSPVFNLYNMEWPILTSRTNHPPAKFVFADEIHKRVGVSTDSLVANGCIISGGRIDRCILSPNVRINSYADVKNSVLFESSEIGRRCQIENSIVEKGVFVPPDSRIGFNEEEDRDRGIFVDDGGIRVVTSDVRFGK